MQYVLLITIKVSVLIRYKYFLYEVRGNFRGGGWGGGNFDGIMGAQLLKRLFYRYHGDITF